MINPAQITDYNRSHAELEEFLLFAIMVAGKKSTVEAPKLDRFLSGLRERYGEQLLSGMSGTPFQFIRFAKAEGTLLDIMKEYAISPYRQRYNSFCDAVQIFDLRAVNMSRLMKVRGIGLKTARFFLSHSREDFDEPMLDTHILSWLRDQGYTGAPQATPQNEGVYNYYANVFKSLARQLGLSVTDLDLTIWKQYSKTN